MLKYVNTGIVFQEIPDEVTLSINISNCPCRCPGCHSRYLWQDVGKPLTSEALSRLVNEYGSDITCVCFMGGDAAPRHVNMLACYLHHAYPQLRVAWYSGRTCVSLEINKYDFDYIKIGPYIKHLGSLKDRTTNQRLYKQAPGGEFTDITERFWRGKSI